ncbi:MAG: 50S ribosomal protein L15 [Salinivirgaceae bacterium]|jgi:large subunit ribosomal protein L15|nr:50S ribosomal protein L15 [Bacteroidales bacterium]
MDLSSLTPAKGSVRNSKRIGRGEGSGHGGHATRGLNGAKSRSGYAKKVGFEGGQMPLQRRLPKFGFTNPNRKEYKAINLDVIQSLADKLNTTTIDVDTLIENGLVSKSDLVKILGNGTISSKLEVKAHAFSKSAQAAIEAQSGNVIKL